MSVSHLCSRWERRSFWVWLGCRRWWDTGTMVSWRQQHRVTVWKQQLLSRIQTVHAVSEEAPSTRERTSRLKEVDKNGGKENKLPTDWNETKTKQKKITPTKLNVNFFFLFMFCFSSFLQLHLYNHFCKLLVAVKKQVALQTRVFYLLTELFIGTHVPHLFLLPILKQKVRKTGQPEKTQLNSCLWHFSLPCMIVHKLL